MESAVEEAFERCKYCSLFMAGKGCSTCTCGRSNNTYNEFTRGALRISDRDDRLNGVEETLLLEVGVLHSSDWLWSHAWMADIIVAWLKEQAKSNEVIITF
ncbi:unnamed protein product [Peronospora destructor]|uniref:Uncharacterized protein n=1 Tax=Peronospora destructor TaxID=86335 RepID=A0AAV0TW48_9STRA|nr:unnamed protein product [Peronospora destructor]